MYANSRTPVNVNRSSTSRVEYQLRGKRSGWGPKKLLKDRKRVIGMADNFGMSLPNAIARKNVLGEARVTPDETLSTCAMWQSRKFLLAGRNDLEKRTSTRSQVTWPVL